MQSIFESKTIEDETVNQMGIQIQYNCEFCLRPYNEILTNCVSAFYFAISQIKTDALW